MQLAKNVNGFVTKRDVIIHGYNTIVHDLPRFLVNSVHAQWIPGHSFVGMRLVSSYRSPNYVDDVCCVELGCDGHLLSSFHFQPQWTTHHPQA